VSFDILCETLKDVLASQVNEIITAIAATEFSVIYITAVIHFLNCDCNSNLIF
jgi:hypothetical protein